MGTILDELNPEQRQAAETIHGPVLVLAGAGTGKTRVITFRIAWMLQNGIAPEHILAMTFTNKAAREMKERIAKMVPPERARLVTVGTFHAFCARILRREIGVLGFTPNFTIADDSDIKGILKQAAGEMGYIDASIDEFSAYIGDRKNNLVAPLQAVRNADTDGELRCSHVYQRYQQILENQNMLDFDDMLFFVYRLFHEFPEVLKKYQEQYRYLLVDEYQDTNMVQFKIVEMLAGEDCNLCVVGDDDQSIYGWRGAVVDNILNFPFYFRHKNVKQVSLEQNYRSTNKILTAANVVIARNTERFDKKLWSGKGDGDNLYVVKTASAEDESRFVADLILQEHDEHQRNWRDFAILYRSNHMSRLLEQALREADIPYRLVGGQEFFARKEIKDAAAYLKLIVNPREDQALLRILGVPPRGIGDKAVSELKQLHKQKNEPMGRLLGSPEYLAHLSGKAHNGAQHLHEAIGKYRKLFEEPGDIAGKIKDYLRDVGYLDGFLKIYKDLKDAENRQENVYEFISAVSQFEKRAAADDRHPLLLDFLESYALLDENDRTKEDEQDDNAVTLTTVHAAKGLEFPFVFVIGMEQNMFPHERAIQEGSLNEELRLFYVAITRAQTRLVLSHAAVRMRFGQEKYQRPSQFLELLPEELAERYKPDDLIRELTAEELTNGFADIFSMLKD